MTGPGTACGESPWVCEAYGPEGVEAGAVCFFVTDLGQRTCASEETCRARLAVERRRIHDRIAELAGQGDPVAEYLAAEFPDPEQILGGSREGR